MTLLKGLNPQAPFMARLGLLAVASSTGVVTIYSLPHPEALCSSQKDATCSEDAGIKKRSSCVQQGAVLSPESTQSWCHLLSGPHRHTHEQQLRGFSRFYWDQPSCSTHTHIHTHTRTNHNNISCPIRFETLACSLGSTVMNISRQVINTT